MYVLDKNGRLAFPEYAPLPTPFILHLLGEDRQSFYEQFCRASQPFRKKIAEFEEQIMQARRKAYSWMCPYVQDDTFSLNLFRGAVAREIAAKPASEAEKKEQISRTTIQKWRERNILPPAPRALDYDRCAAILIAATIDSRVQGFLPHIEENESSYFCFKLDHPQASWTTCPVPLPNLSASTLLWTPWPTFDPLWLSLETFAIRWAGATMERDGLRWTVSKKELEIWNPAIATFNAKLLDFGGLGKRAIHDLADATLLQLALSSLPQLSLYTN